MYKMKLRKSSTKFIIVFSIGCALYFNLNVYAYFGEDNSQDRDSMNDIYIKKISDKLRKMGKIERELTEDEAKLIAKHADKMYRVKELLDYASQAARVENAKDVLVPQNVYKDVLWGFFLAREYGSDVVKEVTDAYTIGKYETESFEVPMNYKNIEIGAKYALDGVDEKDVLSKMMNDSEVEK